MAQIAKSFLLMLLFSTPLLAGNLNDTFANYLEQSGDLKSAVVEYERLVVDSSFKYNPDSLHLKIARLYMRLGAFNRANRELDYLPETEYIDNLKGISYIFSGEFAKSRKYFSNDTLKGISYLMQDKFVKAKEYIHLDPIPQKKHPVVGAVLSSIIPGSGKFYAGRKFDGIYSFLLILSPAISSYYYFNKGSKTAGYIYGTIGGLLYLGNIYGSYKACEIYNSHQLDTYRQRELVKFQFTKWF